MSESIAEKTAWALPNAKKALNLSIKSWFVVALCGQWAFAFYILTIYTLTALYDLAVTDFSPSPNLKEATGHVLIIFFLHVLPAIYLSAFGILQLIPKLRSAYPRFHRINGRLFLLFGLTGALTGLYLQWSKGWQTNTAASLGITLNGLLIVVGALLAWRFAVQKRFDLHQRAAIHTFFLVNGVWTFRLYLMGWYLVNQGPNGNTPNIDGPMDIFLSFACYLLPMLFAEMVFWAQKQQSELKTWVCTFATAFGTLITLIGVIAAVMMMWSPRIVNLFNAV
ncbi:membrane protein [Alteromonas sp. KC3]|uniref:DUF2306 domain-containing protein n=1 Tax=unclassified Alteromonas TaxID=2614992 RepID=UPI0019217B86|nr:MULTISPECIES: DUF2306 domain-containing protein [unclassified Alteromonas]BCO20015.1 membrane protein [Alteromonas sp. KC3]BCO23980.1 membrane protein [Alteromonas sp. KC14]